MSRGRTRHQGSRRRAYSARQREVRERRSRAEREHEAWSYQGRAVELEPVEDEPTLAWTLRLQGRPAAA
jgi:hypothetical protein